MPLMNKPAHASTQSRKWSETEPKPAEVLTHWQVVQGLPCPCGLEADSSLTCDAGDCGGAGQVSSTAPSPPSASQHIMGITLECLSQRQWGWPATPSWNTLSQHLPFSSHNHSTSRRWSCQELSSCTFSTAKARQLAHLPKKQAEEGFWRRKINRRTTQDADVNQNWERRWMWRLLGSQLHFWLLVSHFSPVVPELRLCSPDLHCLSCAKVSTPLPHLSLGSLLLVLPT